MKNSLLKHVPLPFILLNNLQWEDCHAEPAHDLIFWKSVTSFRYIWMFRSICNEKQTNKNLNPKTEHFPYSRGWSACHTHTEEDLSPAAHSFLIFLLGRPPDNTQPWHNRGKAVWRILKPLQMALAEAGLPVDTHNKLSDQTLIFGREVEVIFFRVPSTPQYNSR